MGCNNCTDTKYTCGSTKSNAYCVYIDKSVLPEWSELQDEDCVVVYETTGELYSEVSDIKKSLGIGETYCMDYPEEDGGGVLQKTINEVHAEELCILKEEVKNVAGEKGLFPYCDLEYYDLIDEVCPVKPSSACDFYQFVLDKLKQLSDGK